MSFRDKRIYCNISYRDLKDAAFFPSRTIFSRKGAGPKTCLHILYISALCCYHFLIPKTCGGSKRYRHAHIHAGVRPMKMIDAKSRLNDLCMLRLLSYIQYRPTPEKSAALASAYRAAPDVQALACVVNGRAVGLIVVRRCPEGGCEILRIGVDPSQRRHGIGAALVAFAARRLAKGELRAETDGDAVGFYRACGFSVVSLGEKYPGCVRYLCRLIPS